MELKNTYADRAIHEKWESVYRTSGSQNEFNDRIMDRILGLMNPSPKSLFLDAGCGIGDHSARIGRRGLRCIGVDISETILDEARRKISGEGLDEMVSFQPEKLEQLSFADNTFDFVHCRGVLMHIPDWERALTELCRVLKPGGKLVVIETNRSSVEARLVGLVRAVSRRRSRLVETPGGLEFWSDRDGNPFVVRIADIGYIVQTLGSMRMEVRRRISTEFWDINRFPRGWIRGGVIGFNRLWFSLGFPATLSVGNAIVAEKLPARL
ncbi:MAG: class I SAM-dependent methyltransferase [Isosphaeraceae bacterium]